MLLQPGVERQRISDDPLMVECQGRQAFNGEGSGACRIRSSHKLAAARSRPGQEGGGDDVPPRIASRIGVDSNQPQKLNLKARLLARLTYGSRLHRLPHLHKAPRQCIAALEGWIVPSDENYPSPIENCRICCQKWCRYHKSIFACATKSLIYV